LWVPVCQPNFDLLTAKPVAEFLETARARLRPLATSRKRGAPIPDRSDRDKTTFGFIADKQSIAAAGSMRSSGTFIAKNATSMFCAPRTSGTHSVTPTT
jgi:hypothetical protein